MVELIDTELKLERKESEGKGRLMDQSKGIGNSLEQVSKPFCKGPDSNIWAL